jgi:arabinogalactan oligomer/maltooligosaccharide transport system permease protein
MMSAPTARLAALCLLLAAVAAPACAPRERPLVVWHSYRGAEEAALLASIDAFRRTSPLPVEVLGVPNEALASKLTSAIPRGNGPDLFIFAHERIGGWVRAGLLAPAPPVSDALPETLAALRFDGQSWGYPLAFKSLALFVNRDLVAGPPDTTDAFLNPPALPANTFAVAWPTGSLYYHAPWLIAAGAGTATGLLKPDGGFDWQSPETLASFAFLARLVAVNTLPRDASGATVTALFNEGRLAWAVNGPWFIGEIAAHRRWSVHPLPAWRHPTTAATAPARPFLTVEAAFVSARARHPELAHALAAHLAGPESAALRARDGRQAVANATTWTLPDIAADPVLGAFRAQLADAMPMDSRPEMQLVWEPGDLALKQLMRGAHPDDAALAAARRQAAITDPTSADTPRNPAEPLPWFILIAVATIAALWMAVRNARRRGHTPRDPLAPRAAPWVLPAVVATAILAVVPFVVGLVLAFFHHDSGTWTFIGAENFTDILGARRFDPLEPLSFYYALLVTVLWTAINVALHVGIGFALALVLNRPLLALKPVYRVLLVLPWAVPSYITALVWKGLFHTQLGAINGILDALGLSGIAWFDSFGTAFFANTCANAWLGFPFMMVISLGALQAIPRDLLEAAAVDGASRWQRFRHITLPLVKPALVPAILLGVVWTFNQFNIIYLVSGGAPDNATDILISEAWRWAFARREQYGYAAAYAALIFAILLVWARISMRISRSLEAASGAAPAKEAT